MWKKKQLLEIKTENSNIIDGIKFREKVNISICFQIKKNNLENCRVNERKISAKSKSERKNT